MSDFYSNGKLLISGEYVVLDGAKSLALPTTFGQSLVISTLDEEKLIWESIDVNDNTWFSTSFSIENGNIIHPNTKDELHTVLHTILTEAKRLNPTFLNSQKGFYVKTKLTFPRNWGLGSSSTLINNIADWAKVNPYALLWNAFSGSGYDIACAKHDTAIHYQLLNKKPKVSEVTFNPSFINDLYFIHLNKKQNSRNAIKNYRKLQGTICNEIKVVNEITDDLTRSTSIEEFAFLLKEHEQIISGIIKEVPVQERLFPDYFGQLKSLGAWGGDFILATGNGETPAYFKAKGYKTILPFKEMIL